MPSISSIIAGMVAGAARDRNASEDAQLQQAQLAAALVDKSEEKRPTAGRRLPPKNTSDPARPATEQPTREAAEVARSSSERGRGHAPGGQADRPAEGGPLADLFRFLQQLRPGRPSGS